MKRIKVEEKYFKIVSDDFFLCGHGYNDINKGKVYYEGLFISEEDCKNKLDMAIQEWESFNTWCRPHKPELQIFWKTLTIQEMK